MGKEPEEQRTGGEKEKRTDLVPLQSSDDTVHCDSQSVIKYTLTSTRVCACVT